MRGSGRTRRLTRRSRGACGAPGSWGETVGTVDRETIYEELRRVRVAFRRLVEDASPGDLARASAGTRWTNQQLLFHMLFGYLVTRALIVLAGMFARLPASVSRVFARLLDAVTGRLTGPATWARALEPRSSRCSAWQGNWTRSPWRWSSGYARRPTPGCAPGCTTRCDGIPSSRTS
jgi:hypothetical protein